MAVGCVCVCVCIGGDQEAIGGAAARGRGLRVCVGRGVSGGRNAAELKACAGAVGGRLGGPV